VLDPYPDRDSDGFTPVEVTMFARGSLEATGRRCRTNRDRAGTPGAFEDDVGDRAA